MKLRVLAPSVSLLLLPLALLISGSALAEEPAAPGAPAKEEKKEEGRYPVAEAERPLTLPRMILGGELDFTVPRIAIPNAATGGANATTFANLSLGASFGVTDDLTVRAQVAPLQLAGPGGFHYGQSTGYFGVDNVGPGVGATYRFLKGEFELAASLDLNLITITDYSGVVITPGVVARYHLGKSLRIDGAAYLPIARATATVGGMNFSTVNEGVSHTGVVIPLSVLYDITEPIHVGVATGFQIGDFSDVGNTTGIPLGLFAGYALAGKDGPILDIDPFFTFSQLFTPGGASGTDSGSWVIGLQVGGFLYF